MRCDACGNDTEGEVGSAPHAKDFCHSDARCAARIKDNWEQAFDMKNNFANLRDEAFNVKKTAVIEIAARLKAEAEVERLCSELGGLKFDLFTLRTEACELLDEARPAFVCRCDEAYTARRRHEPNAKCDPDLVMLIGCFLAKYGEAK